MKKKILVFNWKMNPQKKKTALKIFSEIVKEKRKSEKKNANIEIVVSPPAIFLDSLVLKNKNKGIKFSGQNNFFEKSGSYTGEISCEMLKSIGAKYSIVGHSERRKNFNEDGNIVRKKIKSLVENNMKAIFCIGEDNRDKDGYFINKITEQIIEGLKDLDKVKLKNILIAYEPVWAIGEGGREIKSNELEQVVLLIKKVLLKKIGDDADKVKILYGGSVNEENISDLSKIKFIDGFLLGRSSLSKKSFSKIIENFYNQKDS